MSLTVKFIEKPEATKSPTSLKCINHAIRVMPSGKVCGFCGADNDYADEYGWIYIDPYNELTGRPTCWKCFNSEKGILHRARVSKALKFITKTLP